MKSPLVFSGPGIARGTSDAFVYLYDIFPTLCDLAGIDAPAAIDGRSFAEVVQGRSHRARDTIFLAYRDVQRAVHQGDWKLIRYPKINETQLFDLRDDPNERRNLAASDRERAQAMTQLLEAQQRDYGDLLELIADQPAPRAVTAGQLNAR